MGPSLTPGRCRGRAVAAGAAFTLIELLAVLGVIAVLSSLLLPATEAVRAAGLRTQTRVQFTQWALAMEQFHQEYGHYPAVATDGVLDPAKWAPALLGQLNLRGDPLPADASAAQLGGNLQRRRFLQLSPDDLTSDRTALRDAFGNQLIAVRVDLTGDGRIDNTDTDETYPAHWLALPGAAGATWSPVAVDPALASGPLPARVVFYSIGRGRSASDLVLSWQ